ncbi:MAG: hypothetical protein LBD31_08480 [Treponema sp.]|jgi:hypothetical protein|nr:hypothetical protein [Treponema sp.]
MGRIKSALEIAMERTEAVKGDKTSIGLFEAKQRGKRLANRYLAGETSALEELKKAAGDEKEALRSGCFDVLVSQISLPGLPEEIKRLEAAGEALAVIIEDRRFAPAYKQFLAAVSQYLSEASQYEEAIKRQYAPKLRQKEEELARRLGRGVKIDPFQDPEFIAFYNQNMNSLRAGYEALIEEIRTEAKLLFNGES